MLFDTHTHLCEPKFDHDRDEIINNLSKNNVGRIIEVGDDIPSSHAAVALAQKYPFVYCSVGVHPYCTKEMTDADIETLRTLATNANSPRRDDLWSSTNGALPSSSQNLPTTSHIPNSSLLIPNSNPCLAIGEIGLDYHANHHNYKKTQKIWFEKQILLAQELALPIIVHVRDAYADCLTLLQKHNVTKGIIHCFSGDVAFMQEVTQMGLYVAFGGAMTYSNANNIRQAATLAPIDKILLETDCPYLIPNKIKKSRNEPKYVSQTALLISQLREIPLEEIEKITWSNACALFNLPEKI